MNQQIPRFSSWEKGTLSGEPVIVECIFTATGMKDGKPEFPKKAQQNITWTKDQIETKKKEISDQYNTMVKFWNEKLDIMKGKKVKNEKPSTVVKSK